MLKSTANMLYTTSMYIAYTPGVLVKRALSSDDNDLVDMVSVVITSPVTLPMYLVGAALDYIDSIL